LNIGMDSSASSWNLTGESHGGRAPANAEEPPPLGAIDIVEAFTAMRHEWRGQTKETRALAEQLQVAVAQLQALQDEVSSRATDDRSEAAAGRPLVQVLVETDHQLSRAITAIEQWESQRRVREADESREFDRRLAEMSPLARWFARPLLATLADRRSAGGAGPEHPALEGLSLVSSRLRRDLHELGIERIDVQGRPFDAEMMHAIGTVASSGIPAGYIAEQLTPAYRWQGRIIRYADVRVAQ
jgi:molecular chaperone GrpE